MNRVLKNKRVVTNDTIQKLREAAREQPRNNGKFANKPRAMQAEIPQPAPRPLAGIKEKLRDRSAERIDRRPPLWARVRNILTDPPNKPNPKDPNRLPVYGNPEVARKAIEKLRVAAYEHDIAIVDGVCANGELGQYERDPKTGAVTITIDKRQGALSQLSTVTHELAHALDPWTQQVPEKLWGAHRASFETVAQIVSQQVCEQLGVDNRMRTDDYLKSWNDAGDVFLHHQIGERAEASLRQVMGLLRSPV